MDAIKDIAIVIGLLGACWGLYRGVVEFQLQGKQKRAEIFLKKQGEFFGNVLFNDLRTLLESDSEELRTRPFEQKRAYLTFFEEIAILKNSGLVNPDLAYYMFGYYAVRCLESQNFWYDINKADAFWNVFNRFAGEMQTRLRDRSEVVGHALEV